MGLAGGGNHALSGARRARRLTQAQLAERVSARLGLDPPLDGNYVSKLERGVHTWPNADYRTAFRKERGVRTDAERGFYCSRSVPPEEDGVGPGLVTDWSASNQDSAAVAETATLVALRWLMLPAGTLTSRTGTCRQVGHGDIARLRIARSQLKVLDDTMGGGAAPTRWLGRISATKCSRCWKVPIPAKSEPICSQLSPS